MAQYNEDIVTVFDDAEDTDLPSVVRSGHDDFEEEEDDWDDDDDDD